MGTTGRRLLIVTAAWFATCGAIYADDKPTVGRKIGDFLRKTDRRIQQQLDRRPKVRERMTRGINVFADNVIDAVTPEADAQTRRVQRAAVQMMLNPSHTESNRAFNDMQDSIADRFGGDARASSRYSNTSAATTGHYRRSTGRASTGTGHVRTPRKTNSSPGSRLTLPPAVLAMGRADWHDQLWSRADHGLLATSQAINGGFSRTHAKLTRVIADNGLSPNAASTLATVAMGLIALFGLYLLLFFPRRRLKRQNRRLRRQLEGGPA